jgi:hypothetical protein
MERIARRKRATRTSGAPAREAARPNFPQLYDNDKIGKKLQLFDF